MVVDGTEGKKEYDRFLPGSRLVFDSPTKLHTLAGRGDEIFLLEIEITEQPSGHLENRTTFSAH